MNKETHLGKLKTFLYTKEPNGEVTCEELFLTLSILICAINFREYPPTEKFFSIAGKDITRHFPSPLAVFFDNVTSTFECLFEDFGCHKSFETT